MLKDSVRSMSRDVDVQGRSHMLDMTLRPDIARSPPSLVKPLKLLHIISGLHVGGAEKMLFHLLRAMDRSRFDPYVISLLEPGSVAAEISALCIEIHSLELNRWSSRPLSLPRLMQITRRIEPDIIHGWMYYSNLLSTMAWLPRRRRSRLVWGVHHSIDRLSDEKALSRQAIALNARASRLPDVILYCSRVSAEQHHRLGFSPERASILPNGIDTQLFRPDPQARERLRAVAGIEEERPIIGMAARLHPMKDHANLLKAAAHLWRQDFPVHLVLMGRDVERDNPKMAGLLADLDLPGLTLLGERDDLPQLLPGFDLFVVPSAYGEAFPLVIGEAMASGVPCVATDVGDAKLLVGEHGRIVPPRDHLALAAAIREWLDMPAENRQSQGRAARQRIVENFALQRIAAEYENLYARLVPGRAA
jgi:glycosyltransferase involved in cell wall biosynthesis